MLHVAVSVIRDDNGRILLSRRQAGTHLAGLWEFPGGKLEPNESLAEGLKREIHEELAIQVTAHRPLIQVRHSYPERDVLLDVHLVQTWQGKPQGMEGQQVAWVEPDQIDQYALPPADQPILTALSLPDVYAITPVDFHATQLLQIAERGEMPAGLIQLRMPHLDAEAIAELARALLDLGAVTSETLLVKERSVAEALGCGLHLTSAELMQATTRPLPSDQWLAASCHNEEELQHAEAIGVDFTVVSSVMPTSSHPDARPIGWEQFGLLAASSCLPVYALGGVGPRDVETAWQAGAQGIAGISAFWKG